MAASKRETQYDRIYQYVKEHGSITPMTAFQFLKITKLATRISEMTKSGKYSVKKTPVSITNRDGKRVRYMEYSKIVKKRQPKAAK